MLGETPIAGKTGEKSEQPMLQRMPDPPQTLALLASGTVMAGDVEAAINAAVGEAATGLVVVIAPDFDGDFAELARGLASAALAHKPLVKLAVVIDPDEMDGARLNSFEASPVRIRQFARADTNSALEWAAAARRGE
jgi:hypothetical protein